MHPVATCCRSAFGNSPRRPVRVRPTLCKCKRMRGTGQREHERWQLKHTRTRRNANPELPAAAGRSAGHAPTPPVQSPLSPTDPSGDAPGQRPARRVARKRRDRVCTRGRGCFVRLSGPVEIRAGRALITSAGTEKPHGEAAGHRPIGNLMLVRLHLVGSRIQGVTCMSEHVRSRTVYGSHHIGTLHTYIQQSKE